MKNRITAADRTIDCLTREGWAIDHTALFNGYRYAGTVSHMQTRKGFDFCRVHHGRCKNVEVNGGFWRNGFNLSCQITTVMRRPATA